MEAAGFTIADVYLLGRGLLNGGMVIADIRRENFRALVAAEDDGEPSRAATRLGKSPGQISHLIGPHPTKNIGNKIARQIEEAYSKPQGWLDRSHFEAVRDEPDVEYRVSVARDPAPHPVADAAGKDKDIITVPVMEAEGSMGHGRLAPEHDVVIDSMRISREWARHNLPAVSSFAALRIITGYGDSMSPTINDGDPVLVDTGITELRLDAIYVLSRDTPAGPELFIKRIQRLVPDGFEIISDNPRHRPQTIDTPEKAGLIVCGRVVWAWNGRKL